MTLRTVDDALHVLDMLAERGEVTARMVASELGRSRSAAYRVIRTLQDRGWTTHVGNGVHQLGPFAVAIAARASATLPLPAFAAPWLRQLSHATDETSTLSILVGIQRVCIDQVESSRQIRMSVSRGKPYPLYAGASGRSILAAMDHDKVDDYLSQIHLETFTDRTITDREKLLEKLENDRKAGYSVALAERDGEAFSIASAIIGRGGVLGSIAICGPLSRYDEDTAHSYGELTKEASAAISEYMGGSRVELAE